MNGALDAVGLASFGPEVCCGPDAVDRVCAALSQLPDQLRDAWLDAAVVSDGEQPCVALDRRMLSVETKRALETIPGLEFRQGLATAIRMANGCARHEGPGGEAPPGAAAGGTFEVGTAFGEWIPADVVVLAPGLSLGGRVSVGEATFPGGRYGETPSDGLRSALESLGAEWRIMSVEVGPRYGGAILRLSDGSSAGVSADAPADRPGMRLVAARPLRAVLEACGDCRGPESDESEGLAEVRCPSRSPSAPHRSEDLGHGWFVRARVTDRGVCAEKGFLAYPDGVVTDEIYTRPSGRLFAMEAGAATCDATRPAQEIRGLAVANLDLRNRLTLKVEGSPWVWVAGRAAGARDYLESLLSGLRVAEDVAAHVGSRGCGWGPCASPAPTGVHATSEDRAPTKDAEERSEAAE